MEVAIEEVERVVKRGGVRGLDITNTLDMPPLWDPYWHPSGMRSTTPGCRCTSTRWALIPTPMRKTLWGSATGVADRRRRWSAACPGGLAVHITGFQIYMSTVLMSLIYGGVLERTRACRMVIGEGGIGWIPYILDRMDLEWEDQFKDLGLTDGPSDYGGGSAKATYPVGQRSGSKLLDELGEDNVMWASDFPHPDGIWPDSSEYIERELGHLPAPVLRKVICENAGKLYGFLRT